MTNDTQEIITKKHSHYSIPKKNQENKSLKSSASQKQKEAPGRALQAGEGHWLSWGACFLCCSRARTSLGNPIMCEVLHSAFLMTYIWQLQRT